MAIADRRDLDEFVAPAGRVIDSQLSEHQAQGMLGVCFNW